MNVARSHVLALPRSHTFSLRAELYGRAAATHNTEHMPSGFHAAWVLGAALLAAAGLSCTVETTRYQAPEALARKTTPEPPPGMFPTDTPVTPERICNPPAVPDTACAETWTGIYTTLINGNWKCSASPCHAPGTGVPPFISPTDAKAARKSLLTYVMGLDLTKTPPKQYVDQCSRDPAVSSITCNIRTEANTTACGSSMPKLGVAGVQGTPATAAEVNRISTWIRCGSPDN